MNSDTILAVHKIRAIEGKLTIFIIVEYSGMIQNQLHIHSYPYIQGSLSLTMVRFTN